ncbi:putative transporter [Toxoplasma gondii MAS]|uniref:Putative transporter n=2 Tax=Toxoplasma gondii TaxID=5811 RepID=A0A086QDU4_TOXGO|nr:putative transporter [Toxoplasma gondii MAS]PUA90823.1 putative transporter [Toxoplasma gondii TgCATBr9]
MAASQGEPAPKPGGQSSSESSSSHDFLREEVSLAHSVAAVGPERAEGARRRGLRSWSACLHAIRRALPFSDVPPANQKAPLGVNRYVLLVIYALYITSTGVFFHGWPSVAALIFRNNGFESLCERDPLTGAFVDDQRVVNDKPYICDKQDAAVQRLYTMTWAICSTMCAFAGALLDFAGPRWTAMVGQMFNLCGWICLSFAHKSDMFYYLGFTTVALGCETAFLPTFCITRLFPGAGGLVITILGSAVSTSYAVPVVLNAIMDAYGFSFQSVALGYTCACPLVCVFVAGFLMPRRRFLDDNDEGAMQDLHAAASASLETNSEQEPPRKAGMKGPEETAVATGQTKLGKVAFKNASFETRPASLQNDAAPTMHAPVYADTDKRDGDAVKQGSIESALQWRPKEGGKRAAFAQRWGPRLEPFFHQLLSERYLLIVLYKIGVVLAASYFQQAARRVFSEQVVNIRGILLPFSFIPCILLGKLADVIGICRVLFLMNIFGLFMYGFSLSSSVLCGCISVVCFTLYMSFFSSQIFVYVEATFSPNDFGKLCGLSVMIGGIVGLLATPLYEHVTVQLSKGDPFSMQIVMIMILVIQLLWLTRLYSLWRKNPHPYVSLGVRSAAHLERVGVHSIAEGQLRPGRPAAPDGDGAEETRGDSEQPRGSGDRQLVAVLGEGRAVECSGDGTAPDG